MAPLALLLWTFLATATLLAGPSYAGTKFDLSPYLANLSAEGDTRVFDRSTGGQRTVTVLEVTQWAKGWREVVRSETTGTDDDGWSLSEGFLIPGKQLLSGDELYDNGLSFRVRKPVKDLLLSVTPGKPQRINQKAQVFFDGIYAGKAESGGSWWIEGLEKVETPSGSYENALRSRAITQTRLRLVPGAAGCSNGICGRDLLRVSTRTAWYAAGLGFVRADHSVESFVDGPLAEAESWSEALRSGSIGGVPFP